MIEAILETKPWVSTSGGAGTITTAVGTNAITGAGFTALAHGDILVWDDDAGVLRMGTVDVVTDDNNVTLLEDTVSVTTGLAWSFIDTTNQNTFFFKADSTILKSPVVKQNTIAAMEAGGSIIDADEGVLIKSAFIRMPYQFTQADTQFVITLNYLNSTGGVLSPITNVGESGNLYMPMENTEVPINIYVPTPGVAWQIGAQLLNGIVHVTTAYNPYTDACVSMMNVPTAFDGLYIPIIFGIRMQYAIALT